MTIIQSIILAIVEGLTEFLPVSSTGHMILTEGALQMQSTDYLKAFTVMIQFGAILSVVVLYWRRFIPWNNSPTEQELFSHSGWNLYLLLLVGCLPAGILGLLLEEYIDSLLGNTWVVVSMLALGGVIMILMDKLFTNDKPIVLTITKAISIGFFQCIAMIPGVSRSMATIFGGMQQGLTRKQAAEFSFFLAIPTMAGATLLKAYKLFKIGGLDIFIQNWQTLLIGNIVAFVVALLAIKGFIGFVTKYGFAVFGYYRILLAVVVAVLILCGLPISFE